MIFSSKVNMEHSRISRGRKSLEKAVDLHKLPVIQVIYYSFDDLVLIDLLYDAFSFEREDDPLSGGVEFG